MTEVRKAWDDIDPKPVACRHCGSKAEIQEYSPVVYARHTVLAISCSGSCDSGFERGVSCIYEEDIKKRYISLARMAPYAVYLWNEYNSKD